MRKLLQRERASREVVTHLPLGGAHRRPEDRPPYGALSMELPVIHKGQVVRTGNKPVVADDGQLLLHVGGDAVYNQLAQGGPQLAQGSSRVAAWTMSLPTRES